jgi:arginine decarboxylase-like protein
VTKGFYRPDHKTPAATVEKMLKDVKKDEEEMKMMYKDKHGDVSFTPAVHTMLVTYSPRVLNFNGGLHGN